MLGVRIYIWIGIYIYKKKDDKLVLGYITVIIAIQDPFILRLPSYLGPAISGIIVIFSKPMSLHL